MFRLSFAIVGAYFRMADTIVEAGRNCWRREIAGRVAFLVDAADYYEAFADALEAAERSVVLVAWDVHSKTPIRVRPDGEVVELGELVHAALERNPALVVHILTWDFIVFYAGDRERRGTGLLCPGAHPRLNVHFDSCHPNLASHHQKIVVVDDRLAFSGGLDFTAGRRDTPAHPAIDPLRVKASGEPAPPFHDVVMAVDGDAAKALGELCRERWLRATGERLEAVRSDDDPWPGRLEPDLHDVPVAIARTEPAHDGRREVREVEALNVDAIRAARRDIYIETQYFAVEDLIAPLAERLDAGVEIVVVVPSDSTDWLEASTLGALRARMVRELRAADRFGRLRVCHPTVPDLGDLYVKVHSKLMIVDDRFLRIGSSNLCNRSLGVDTECDLAIEPEGRADVVRAIARLRARLLGEHLGTGAEAVERAIGESGSLVAAVDALRGGDRTLVDLDDVDPSWKDVVLADPALVDPPRPLHLARWVRSFWPAGSRTAVLRRVLTLLLVALVAAVWYWTPLWDAARPHTLARLAESLRGHPAAPFVVVAGYVIGTILLVPVNVLILATALTFDPLASFAYAWLGCVAGGVASYWIGRLLGGDVLRRVGGAAVVRLNRRIAQRGVLAVAVLRLVPVAPFAIVNFAAGASSVTLRDYTLGTALGMVPGILLITLFGGGLSEALARPSPTSFAVLAALSAAMVAAAVWIERWLGSATPQNAEEASGG